MVFAAAIATTMWAVAGQATAPQPRAKEATPPVSTERIGQALQRPSLKMPPPEALAVFRIKVEAQGSPVETVLEAVRRELKAQSRLDDHSSRNITNTPPLVTSPNLIDLAASVVNRINDARRARAERISRREVAEELAAFCAQHDCSVLESGPDPGEGLVLPGARAKAIRKAR